MKKVWKVLNLYSGIGGNRKLWENVEVTAVEIDLEIASVYQDFFPDDNVVIEDAHQYLLEHYNEFDFIWSSPPCPSHSRIRRYAAVGRGQNKPVYPDFRLYEEIVFLRSYFSGKFAIENVIAFYKPLIKPFEFASHWFWSNFVISKIKGIGSRCHNGGIKKLMERKGFDLSNYNVGIEKKLMLRNCVEPELGCHILDCARKYEQKVLDV